MTKSGIGVTVTKLIPLNSQTPTNTAASPIKTGTKTKTLTLFLLKIASYTIKAIKDIIAIAKIIKK